MKPRAVKVLLAVVGTLLAAAVAAKLVVGAVNVPFGSTTVDEEQHAQRINVPEGFTYTVFSDDIPNARMLRVTRQGDVLVAMPSRDQIWWLEKDKNGDGRYDSKRMLMVDLDSPNGMDFFQDWLYVAEDERIFRIRFDHEKGMVSGSPEEIISDLPDGGNHWKKTLRFGPEAKLYLTIGSSCNVCIEKDARRATMMRFNADGSEPELYATGLRNSAGFDWDNSGALFATDNGRDLLGDDYPPCELNRIQQGGFYGWPFMNGSNDRDPDFFEKYAPALVQSHGMDIDQALPLVHAFRAHNAPLGIHFLRGHSWPADWHDVALVALHGSWNRSEKDGYKVVSLHANPDGSFTEKDFMSGFLQDDNVIGRPAEIAEDNAGNVYISDDYAGAIYRVSYRSPGL
jgi:glucose/arabinose dehydrogenase